MDEKTFIDADRLPVLIGKDGETKRLLEQHFDSTMAIDSQSAEIVISGKDAVSTFTLKNVISAINFGHNPKKALKLEDEHMVLDVIDVKSMVKDAGRCKVIMGRIIGKEGSTRKVIEEASGCDVSVKDHYVSVIGPYENTLIVHDALKMLISGAAHKSFYAFLEKNAVRKDPAIL
ncbi:RNA-processing protein [Candidatus Woesearchaeota archaeon]|nr:RNA-processing protein [Nanoarchaeota archaeon]MCB9370065.1 RNA-processing protein [Candidatus Woesearchaeota archaeon]USN44595.1 MAG: RNA-processing protein [Candidatus Woesearchaeota archaeon]